MIIGYIKGQQLELKSELIVADSIDYLTAKFVFKTADWQGLSKWAHFKKGSTVYDIPLTADSIKKSDHLNLSEGEWEVYLHGNAFEGGEVVERITTEVAKLTVKGTGSLNGEPFPEIPASETERINAELADHEERIDALEQGGGGGGGTTDHRQLSNRDAANQHPISAITGLQSALDGKQASGDYATSGELDALADIVDGKADAADIPSLAGYATEAYVQNYHDNTKQDVIIDLATIRSGATLGATAVQPEAGKGLFSGNYNDLANKPTIPEAVTDAHINSLIDAKLGVIENGSY